MTDPVQFWHMPTITDVLTLIALIAGPLTAVYITRRLDEQREIRAKRVDVFKTLMRTRGMRLSPDHVGALNLVEIEFYSEQKVQDALDRYFQHLNTSQKLAPEQWQQFYNHNFTKLLSEMAKSLGYQIEQLQLLTGGYAPQGWEAAEKRRTDLQDKFIDLLDGKTSLPVRHAPITMVAPANTQTTVAVPPGFPPPPTGT